MADEHYLKRELYQRVREDSEIFEFLQAGSLDGIWYWDMENPEHEWLSPRFKEVFGYAEDEVPHTSSWWQERIFEEDLPAVLDTLKRHIEEGAPYDQVVRYRHKDGSTVWVRCRGLVIRDAAGEPVRMLGAHTEVTELKRTEEELAEARDEALSASRLKSQFLTSMSHELRTPLNSIIGFSELLLDGVPGPLNEDQEQCLNDVLESGRHLLGLINDILDLSRVEAGRMALVPESFELAPVVAAALTTLGPLAELRGVELEHKVSEDLEPVHADPMKVKQVLINLLSNAVKFTPEGGRVTVRADLCRGRPERLEVAVADTGLGIAAEDQEAIFDEFRQAGRDRDVEGTGLGLALCRRLLRLMDGDIRVESELGRGSTFLFTLPVTAAL